MPTSLESIQAAAEALEGNDTTQEAAPPVVAEAPPVETPEADAAETSAAEARARDEKGRFSPKTTGEPTKPRQTKPKLVTTPPAPLETEAPPVETPAPATSAVKPPQSWKPQAREKWSTLPPEIQEEVLRREKETAGNLHDSAESRRFREEWQRATAPFAARLGPQPVAAITNMLQVDAGLANPATGAKVAANILRAYRIDINALAAELDGQAQQPTAQQQPAFDPQTFEQNLIQKFQAQLEAKQLQAQVNAFINSGKAEHFDKVKGLMASLVDEAQRQGETLSLEEAYARACRAHPEAWEAMRQKEAEEQAAKVQASTQRARTASVSLKSQPAGVTTPQPKGTLASIEAAAAKLGY